MKTCSQCQVKYPDVLEFCPRDGSPLPPSASGNAAAYDPIIGTTIDGRYAIEAALGEGGMGVVYKARHVLIDKPVAIKILRKEAAQDAASVQRFIQEAKSASKINHSNIVDITDFGVLSDGHAYFVMEFLQGQTLAQAILEGPLFPARVCLIGAQMARGLYAAHTKGIVHRDLKPENVFLLEREGHRDFVKIVDFGIAKVGSGQRLTQVGMVLGTPEYMSPEQATGQETDARVDQYALGCMMYEMLTGVVPFLGERPAQTLTKHVFEAVVPPSKRKPELHIPPSLEAVVLRTLAKKPAERFPSMRELELQLGQVGDELRLGRSDEQRSGYISRSGVSLPEGPGLSGGVPPSAPPGYAPAGYLPGSMQPAAPVGPAAPTMSGPSAYPPAMLPPHVSGAQGAYAPPVPAYVPQVGSSPLGAPSGQPGPAAMAGYANAMPGYHPSMASYPSSTPGMAGYPAGVASGAESRPTRESRRQGSKLGLVLAVGGILLFLVGSVLAYQLLIRPWQQTQTTPDLLRPVDPGIKTPTSPTQPVKQVITDPVKPTVTEPVKPTPTEVRPTLPPEVTVRVRPYPESAIVEVDGRRCRQPCEFRQGRDTTIRVHVHKKGYEDWDKEYRMDRDPVEVSAPLDRLERQHGQRRHPRQEQQQVTPPPSLNLHEVGPSRNELRNPFPKAPGSEQK